MKPEPNRTSLSVKAARTMWYTLVLALCALAVGLPLTAQTGHGCHKPTNDYHH